MENENINPSKSKMFFVVSASVVLFSVAAIGSTAWWIKSQGQTLCKSILASPEVEILNNAKMRIGMLMAAPVHPYKLKEELDKRDVFKLYVKQNNGSVMHHLNTIFSQGAFVVTEVIEQNSQELAPSAPTELLLTEPWMAKDVLVKQVWSVKISTTNNKNIENRINSLSHGIFAITTMPMVIKQITLPQNYKTQPILVTIETAYVRTNVLPKRVLPAKPNFIAPEAWLAKFPAWMPKSISQTECIKTNLQSVDDEYKKISNAKYAIEQLDLQTWYSAIKKQIQQ